MSKVLVLGATGATGKAVINKLSKLDYKVTAVARKERPEGFKGTWLQQNQLIPVPIIKPDHILCCLGTTRYAAGSAENFIKIDHDLVVDLAKEFYKQNPDATFTYVSSDGANSESLFLYLKSKGQTENDLLALNFSKCYILRPRLLLLDGIRPEARWMEKIVTAIVRLIPFKQIFSVHVDKIANFMAMLIKDMPSQVVFSNKEINDFSK
eukprot:NODE_405_length_9256_cov_0.230316.p3 type:complete len:209 gc:universal NODE_405_length_9256_cov_0.230316:1424-2050(+)